MNIKTNDLNNIQIWAYMYNSPVNAEWSLRQNQLKISFNLHRWLIINICDWT